MQFMCCVTVYIYYRLSSVSETVFVVLFQNKIILTNVLNFIQVCFKNKFALRTGYQKGENFYRIVYKFIMTSVFLVYTDVLWITMQLYTFQIHSQYIFEIVNVQLGTYL